jgi:formylglycine-generating enzyme required for sulfatase activity
LNFDLDLAGCVGDTSEVGNYPKGGSPYGALDMAGNVCEWVAQVGMVKLITAFH